MPDVIQKALTSVAVLLRRTEADADGRDYLTQLR